MGWLRSLSLLSVLFAGSVVTAQQQNWNSNGYQFHQQPATSKNSWQDSNSATLWERYSCRESNPVYDCVFCDVSITRDTPGAYFGEVEITHNSQKNLTFKTSVVRKLPETLLRSFGEVELLDLTAVQLEEIVPNAFTNGINIRELYLGFNDIRELPQGVFHNMSSLTKLALDQNSLQRLPRDIFSGTPNLTDLSFANNKLQLIDDNTFQNVNNLQHLLLNSNNLTHFDLSLIPSLIEGNVSSNLLTTLAIPVNLVVLDASHNRINTVTGSNNTKLEKLFLQHNNLTNIAWLHRYSGLVVLDLSYNELEKVTDLHLKKLYRLEQLYLSNNRLVALNLNSPPIRTLKILDVRHNHLLHVESNKDQFSTLEQLYLDHNSIITLKLGSINKLQILTLSHNDWDCKNLEQLFENVSESVINDSDRYCKENYQHMRNICCKESDKPYLDRQIKQSLTNVAEKLQHAEGPHTASNGSMAQLQVELNQLKRVNERLAQLLEQLQSEMRWIRSRMETHCYV
ncbi:leucine-rich repeat-containing protein 15-like [Anopheles marshallii]|uniref:leucine-rich repeat-containing protein 15-like n=1 Tax=Anopheles marshallii TaxID=1521116 RepID=UPI00237AD235|nr:leucine-rich repeat-containing protein 15-like [Anopheles marshallii]